MDWFLYDINHRHEIVNRRDRERRRKQKKNVQAMLSIMLQLGKITSSVYSALSEILKSFY